MKIKCTEFEREWLIKHLGEEIAENYPWNAYPFLESISVELEYLILRKGLTSLDEDGVYNDFGHECQAIHDSLYYQNVLECDEESST